MPAKALSNVFNYLQKEVGSFGDRQLKEKQLAINERLAKVEEARLKIQESNAKIDAKYKQALEQQGKNADLFEAMEMFDGLVASEELKNDFNKKFSFTESFWTPVMKEGKPTGKFKLIDHQSYKKENARLKAENTKVRQESIDLNKQLDRKVAEKRNEVLAEKNRQDKEIADRKFEQVAKYKDQDYQQKVDEMGLKDEHFKTNQILNFVLPVILSSKVDKQVKKGATELLKKSMPGLKIEDSIKQKIKKFIFGNEVDINDLLKEAKKEYPNARIQGTKIVFTDKNGKVQELKAR